MASKRLSRFILLGAFLLGFDVLLGVCSLSQRAHGMTTLIVSIALVSLFLFILGGRMETRRKK